MNYQIHTVRLFFFFQAEDGIRDHCVTGVQTCALPISKNPRLAEARSPTASASRGFFAPRISGTGGRMRTASASRSEERRVGKECKTRRSGYHSKKKKSQKKKIFYKRQM